jgi:hypothetical protein
MGMTSSPTPSLPRDVFLMLSVNTWPRLTLVVLPNVAGSGRTQAYWRLNDPVLNGMFVARVGRA